MAIRFYIIDDKGTLITENYVALSSNKINVRNFKKLVTSKLKKPILDVYKTYGDFKKNEPLHWSHFLSDKAFVYVSIGRGKLLHSAPGIEKKIKSVISKKNIPDEIESYITNFAPIEYKNAFCKKFMISKKMYDEYEEFFGYNYKYPNQELFAKIANIRDVLDISNIREKNRLLKIYFILIYIIYINNPENKGTYDLLIKQINDFKKVEPRLEKFGNNLLKIVKNEKLMKRNSYHYSPPDASPIEGANYSKGVVLRDNKFTYRNYPETPPSSASFEEEFEEE